MLQGERKYPKTQHKTYHKKDSSNYIPPFSKEFLRDNIIEL